ncbi:Membrane protein YdfJ [Streptomyces fumanus]
MSTFLYRLGKFSYRRRWIVVTGWIAILLASVGAMIFLVKGFTPGLKIPGSQSQKTTEAMARAFPGGTEQATGTIVFQTKNGGKVTAEPAKQTIEDITQEADGLPGVGSATAPSRDTLTISPDATVGITTITFDAESASDIPTATLSDLSALAGKGRGSGLNVELAGAAVPAQEENPASQAGTLLVTLLVLLFVFRSVRTAIIPICTAMAAVGLGTCAVLASTGFLDMHSTAMTLSSMLGLAVGVDYALFIMSRHQQQVLRGMDPEESAGRAVGTAGNAVVIAGATVIVALAGLAVARIPFVTVMGLAAAFTVTMSVLISLTLVPACLGFRGAKIKTSVIPFLRRRSPRGTDQSALGLRWARVDHSFAHPGPAHRHRGARSPVWLASGRPDNGELLMLPLHVLVDWYLEQHGDGRGGALQDEPVDPKRRPQLWPIPSTPAPLLAARH